MNNSKYLELCEKFRWEASSERGDSQQKVRDQQVGETVLEFKARFKRELFVGDKVEVTTQYLGYDKKIYRIEQKFLKEDGAVAFELSIKGAVFDLKKRRIIRPPVEWVEAFHQI